jgi:hypothetical protein
MGRMADLLNVQGRVDRAVKVGGRGQREGRGRWLGARGAARGEPGRGQAGPAAARLGPGRP